MGILHLGMKKSWDRKQQVYGGIQSKTQSDCTCVKLDKHYNEPPARAVAAGGGGAERRGSGVGAVSSTQTKSVLARQTQVGKQFSSNMPLLVAQIST